MALSRKTYTQTVGGNTQFTVTFPYLKQANVSVEVNGTPVTFTWANATTVDLDVAPAVNDLVELIRSTDNTVRAVDFTDGTVINEQQLDKSALQVFYLVQEAVDQAEGTIREEAGGNLDAISRKIINVVDPTDAQDAATKAYVDAMVASVVAGAGAAAAASAAAAAASEAAAATSESNAATSETNAATSASNASTSETNAAASASAAATSASNAATSESNAAAAVTTALGPFARTIHYNEQVITGTSFWMPTDIFKDNPTEVYWRLVLENVTVSATDQIALRLAENVGGINLSNYEWHYRGGDASVGDINSRSASDDNIKLTESMSTSAMANIIVDFIDPQCHRHLSGTWAMPVRFRSTLVTENDRIEYVIGEGFFRSATADPIGYFRLMTDLGNNMQCYATLMSGRAPF